MHHASTRDITARWLERVDPEGPRHGVACSAQEPAPKALAHLATAEGARAMTCRNSADREATADVEAPGKGKGQLAPTRSNALRHRDLR